MVQRQTARISNGPGQANRQVNGSERKPLGKVNVLGCRPVGKGTVQSMLEKEKVQQKKTLVRAMVQVGDCYAREWFIV